MTLGAFGSNRFLLDADDLAITEHHDHMLFDDRAAVRVVVINVVPTIRVEGVFHHGGPEHEAYLGLRHPGFDLGDHGVGEEIALFDIGPVGARYQYEWQEQGKGFE